VNVPVLCYVVMLASVMLLCTIIGHQSYYREAVCVWVRKADFWLRWSSQTSARCASV